MFKSVLFSCLLLASPLLHASDSVRWIRFYSSDDARYFYDSHSKTNTSMQVNRRTLFNQNIIHGYSSSLATYTAHCQQQTLEVSAATLYDSNGKATGSLKGFHKVNLEENSVELAAFHVLCTKRLKPQELIIALDRILH